MTEIKKGDSVRSFDFPPSRDCYVEGIVAGIVTRCGMEHYEILAERIVWEGQSEPAPQGHRVYPPVNGTPTLRGGVTSGVEKLRS